jgi:threonine synthase
VIYPAGGGVGLLGLWRAFAQLAALGWLTGPPPRLMVAQAAGCAPLVDAFTRGVTEPEPWADPHTVAAGLRIPAPLGGLEVLRALRETGGTAVAVGDDEILHWMGVLAREAGVLAAPEGAATLAAAAVLRERGDLAEGDRVVLLNTGSGLKYLDLAGRLQAPVRADDPGRPGERDARRGAQVAAGGADGEP